MKKILLLACSLLSLWLLLPLFQFSRYESFTLQHIATDFSIPLAPKQQLETAQHIFSELAEKGPLVFDYLGHGSQTVAFVSADGQTVLKLFLAQDLKPQKTGGLVSFLQLLPSYQSNQKQKDRTQKAKKLLQWAESYALSLAHLPQETGLLAFHLNPTPHLFPKCWIKDHHQKTHEIDLDRVVFLLQKKAEPIQKRFAELHEPDAYWQAVHAMEQLFVKHTQKGLSDFNPRFQAADYGFLGDQAILLDPGRVSYSQAIAGNPEPERQRLKHFFASWLSRKYPPPRSVPETKI